MDTSPEPAYLRLREHCGRGGSKDGKSQRMKDSAETTKSPQHGCQSKSNNGHATGEGKTTRPQPYTKGN